MRVRDVMNTKLVTVAPDTSYEGAAILMQSEGLTLLPVVDANGALEGVISEKDLFRAIYPDYSDYFVKPEAFKEEDEREERVKDLRKRPVYEFMTTNIEKVTSQTPLMLAGGLMVAHRIHTLPVVDEDKLVGTISRELVFRIILKHKLDL